MKYRMFAKSVLGPKYAAKGWRCQDRSGKVNFGRTQVIAVADGHGSSDCFRSEYGASLAVKTAFEQTMLYCRNTADKSDAPVRFSDTGILNFKYAVWNEWRRLVKKNWDDYLKLHKTPGGGEVRYESVSEKYKARFGSSDKKVRDRYLYVA